MGKTLYVGIVFSILSPLFLLAGDDRIGIGMGAVGLINLGIFTFDCLVLKRERDTQRVELRRQARERWEQRQAERGTDRMVESGRGTETRMDTEEERYRRWRDG